MDQSTQNKSFKRCGCMRQPVRTLTESTALVSDRLVLGHLPVERESPSEQIVATVSQELAARFDARFNGHAPTRMPRLVGCMPSATGYLQSGCGVRSRQILVTVLRALTPRQCREFNYAEVVRTAEGREVGLAAGQA